MYTEISIHICSDTLARDSLHLFLMMVVIVIVMAMMMMIVTMTASMEIISENCSDPSYGKLIDGTKRMRQTRQPEALLSPFNQRPYWRAAAAAAAAVLLRTPLLRICAAAGLLKPIMIRVIHVTSAVSS
jgi:hypothetical protein